MTAITATEAFVFTLESGQIYKHKTDAPDQRSPYTTPANIVSIMATGWHLYAMDSSGAAYRRWHGGTDWTPYTVPAGTTQLSSMEGTIFALAGDVYDRHDTLADILSTFSLRSRLTLANIVQIDHDEAYSYALTGTGDIYFSGDLGTWTPYPVPISGIVEISSGLEFVYALDGQGRVWRSKHAGYSGWTQMRRYEDVASISIETGNLDRLWFIRTDGSMGSQGMMNWAGSISVAPTPEAWITSDWITSDWIAVAPTPEAWITSDWITSDWIAVA